MFDICLKKSYTKSSKRGTSGVKKREGRESIQPYGSQGCPS